MLQSALWRTARTSWMPAMEVKVRNVGWFNSSHSCTAAILRHKILNILVKCRGPLVAWRSTRELRHEDCDDPDQTEFQQVNVGLRMKTCCLCFRVEVL